MLAADNLAGTAAERTDLGKLAAELIARGLLAHVRADPVGGPYVYVRNPQADYLSERIYSGGDFFTWSWGEPLARRDQVATAAAVIARVLRTIPADSSE